MLQRQVNSLQARLKDLEGDVTLQYCTASLDVYRVHGIEHDDAGWYLAFVQLLLAGEGDLFRRDVCFFEEVVVFGPRHEHAFVRTAEQDR